MENDSRPLLFKKVEEFFRDRDNLILFTILAFALIVRLYYFFLTNNQPLWWDEAEYMLKAKSIALGTPSTGWSESIRPMLFPLLSVPFFFFGLGELPLRFVFVFVSLISILFVYLIGKEAFSKSVGAIAAFLMSVFYIDIFYTTRLLVDIPQILFVNLATFLLIKHTFGSGSRKLIWFILPIILIGTQIRFTVGLLALIFMIFLFAIHGRSLLFKKEWYVSIAAGIACFIPYMIYSFLKFGNPLAVILTGISSAGSERGEGVTAFSIFMEYINYFPNYLPLVFFILFLVGACLVVFKFTISIDKIRTSKDTQKYLFFILMIVLPLLYFGFFVNHFEDRYLFMAFPSIFILSGVAISSIYKYFGRIQKIVVIIALACILIYGGFASLQKVDFLIDQKVTSYEGLRQAGLWMKDNSPPETVIISGGMPEVTYYSERESYPYPRNESEFLEYIEEKNATYIILSIWEPVPTWAYEWPTNNQDKVEVAQAFFLDNQNKQVSAVIYHLI